MTFIVCDVKGLEIAAIAVLSRDRKLIEELNNKVDIHGNNMDMLGFQSQADGRLKAKKFVFRLIYGGTSFSYAQDPDFNNISSKPKYWQGKIDDFYDKYRGIKDWHYRIVQHVQRTGSISIPTGRSFKFSTFKSNNGETQWPITKIKNYPVQGFGADLVCIGRTRYYQNLSRDKEYRKGYVKLCGTIHDSIIVDTYNGVLETEIQRLEESIENVPRNFEAIFGEEFPVPLTAEIKTGPNLKELSKYVKV